MEKSILEKLLWQLDALYDKSNRLYSLDELSDFIREVEHKTESPYIEDRIGFKSLTSIKRDTTLFKDAKMPKTNKNEAFIEQLAALQGWLSMQKAKIIKLQQAEQ